MTKCSYFIACTCVTTITCICCVTNCCTCGCCYYFTKCVSKRCCRCISTTFTCGIIYTCCIAIIVVVWINITVFVTTSITNCIICTSSFAANVSKSCFIISNYCFATVGTYIECISIFCASCINLSFKYQLMRSGLVIVLIGCATNTNMFGVTIFCACRFNHYCSCIIMHCRHYWSRFYCYIITISTSLSFCPTNCCTCGKNCGNNNFLMSLCCYIDERHIDQILISFCINTGNEVSTTVSTIYFDVSVNCTCCTMNYKT